MNMSALNYYSDFVIAFHVLSKILFENFIRQTSGMWSGWQAAKEQEAR